MGRWANVGDFFVNACLGDFRRSGAGPSVDFSIELDFLILSNAITYLHCLEHGESAADPQRGEIARCLGLCLRVLAQGCPFFYLKNYQTI